MSWTISFVSVHGDPLAPLGGPHHGGQNVYVKELSRYLGAYGLLVDVYSRWESEGKPSPEPYSRGTRVIRVPVGPPEAIQKEEIIGLLKDIAVWIPAHQQDEGLRYDLIHTHYYFSGAVGIHLKNTWGIPLVHTYHSLGAIKEAALGDKDHSPDTRFKIEKRICQEADRIIATCPQEKSDLSEYYQADPEKISIVPCGVNLKLFQALPQLDSKKTIGFDPDDFLITYVGRLEERKGIKTLLEAIATLDHPGIQAVIVGGPPTEKPFLSWNELEQDPFRQYTELIDSLGIEKQITFTGGKPQEQLSNYYSAADVTVIPSYYEPFGMTAIEALACGSSVIASRVGGLKSSVLENEVGLLFEPRDAEDLADKIMTLFNEPARNRDMKKTAREYVEGKFSWKAVSRAVVEVYQEVLEG